MPSPKKPQTDTEKLTKKYSKIVDFFRKEYNIEESITDIIEQMMERKIISVKQPTEYNLFVREQSANNKSMEEIGKMWKELGHVPKPKSEGWSPDEKAYKEKIEKESKERGENLSPPKIAGMVRKYRSEQSKKLLAMAEKQGLKI